MIMVVAMLILTLWMYSMCGGLVQAHELAGSITTSQAPSSLTSPPPFLSVPFMGLLTLIFGVGIGVLAQPQLIVRYLTAKDESALKRAVPYGGVFILCMTFFAFSVGPLARVLIETHNIPFPASSDEVLPTVITNIFPMWFVFLFLFAILAAAMSTASALFHTAGASVGRDIYCACKRAKEQKVVLVTRVATCGIILATLILSLSPPDIIPFLCAFFFSLMGSTFLAAYTLMLYWKSLTKTGAWCGILSGFIVSMLWYLLVYYKTVKPIFGHVLVQPYTINMLDPLFVAIPFSFLACYVASKVTKQTSEERKQSEEIFEAMAKES
jgi:SSS family solute:Na+ symporter